MARKSIQRSKTNYYYITARSFNSLDFYISIDDAWDIMTEQLEKLQNETGIKIAAFVLTESRYYLLIQTPDLNIDKVMYFFMKRVTLKIQKLSGRINKIFGCRYKGTLIPENHQLMNVYKFIHRIPINFKLCDRVENYFYNTVYSTPFEIESILPEELNELEWLNREFHPHEFESIRVGLYRTVFTYGKNQSTGRVIIPQVPGI